MTKVFVGLDLDGSSTNMGNAGYCGCMDVSIRCPPRHLPRSSDKITFFWKEFEPFSVFVDFPGYGMLEKSDQLNSTS